MIFDEIINNAQILSNLKHNQSINKNMFTKHVPFLIKLIIKIIKID
jgi:hypothetical protein